MALVICPECGKDDVSDNAVACPRCGYNVKKYYNRLKREHRKLQKFQNDYTFDYDLEEHTVDFGKRDYKKITYIQTRAIVVLSVVVVVILIIDVILATMKQNPETDTVAVMSTIPVITTQPYVSSRTASSQYQTTNDPATTNPLSTPYTSASNTSTHSSAHYCCAEDCYKAGTYAVCGFDGSLEYYCYDHYKQMEDILKMMERDVGSGSYSQHKCEVAGCQNEGAREVEGLSGSTEYYCTKHYNEMVNIINSLFQ